MALVGSLQGGETLKTRVARLALGSRGAYLQTIEGLHHSFPQLVAEEYTPWYTGEEWRGEATGPTGFFSMYVVTTPDAGGDMEDDLLTAQAILGDALRANALTALVPGTGMRVALIKTLSTDGKAEFLASMIARHAHMLAGAAVYAARLWWRASVTIPLRIAVRIIKRVYGLKGFKTWARCVSYQFMAALAVAIQAGLPHRDSRVWVPLLLEAMVLCGARMAKAAIGGEPDPERAVIR